MTRPAPVALLPQLGCRAAPRRMAFALAAAVIGLASGTLPSPLAAQGPARLDTARFATYTVDTLVERARAADSVLQEPPVYHARRLQLVGRLLRNEARQFPLQRLGDDHPGFLTVARRQFVALTPAEVAAVDTLTALMRAVVRAAPTGALSRDAITTLLAPVDAYDNAKRGRSIQDSGEKLRRFERKYGPDAPKRNAAEVVLNYGAQFVRGFAPDSEGWPSRAEVIASYVPTYLALPRDGGNVKAVTAAEAGLRLYIWRDGWGGERGGVLRPGHVSFGVAAAGERDGALQSPLRGRSRFGAFVGWGDAKVAVIGGRDTRVLITRSVQLVPYLF